MLGFLFGSHKDQIIENLRKENNRLSSLVEYLHQQLNDMKQQRDAANARPSFHQTAKDFGLGPQLHKELVRKLYDELEPILSREAFNTLRRVDMTKNPAIHSVADFSPDRAYSGMACLRQHEIRIPEINCVVQTTST